MDIRTIFDILGEAVTLKTIYEWGQSFAKSRREGKKDDRHREEDDV